MKVHTTIFVLLAAVFCGCSSDGLKAGRGDAGQFILQQAVIRGGSPVTTNNLPAISGQWRSFTDKYGVVIRLSRDEYPTVDAFLLQAFGKPRYRADDGKLVIYKFKPSGGAMQLACLTNFTEVCIIRALSQDEWNAELPKVIKAVSEPR